MTIRCKPIKVVAFTTEVNCISASLKSFENEITNIKKTIPKEFLDSAKIDFSREYEYGSEWTAMTIYYYRPETAEEYKKRIDIQKLKKEKKLKEELKTYKKLKEKFEK